MTNICTALVAAAGCFLPFVTPALAELGPPTGCDRCGGAYYTPRGYYGFEGVPAAELRSGIPPAATALAPSAPAPSSGCSATHYGADHKIYLTACRL